MLPHVAHKIFDSERFGRMLAQSSVCASSGIHTNVSSLLLILPAQIGSSSFFIFCFLFFISPVSKTLGDLFCLSVFKTKVLEVVVSIKGRFAI